MKPSEVLTVFKIPANKIISHDDIKKWKEVLKDFKDFDVKQVEQEFLEVLQRCGSDRPLLYYLAAVRRRIIDKKHQYYKSLSMPQKIKNLFR